MKKYSAIAFFTVVLVAMAFLVGKLNLKKSLPITLVVENEEGNEEISSWYNEREDVFYFFVPSYADAGKLRFNVKSSLEYICKQDGKAVDDECPDRFSEGDYVFCVKNREYSVRIKCSENIATLYINTASGSMKSVTKDKSRRENISVRLFTEDGKKDFESTELKLKGRGNSTWKDKEKKPFNILSEDQISFLGMRASSKWVLLANLYDSSNMRNKLAYDAAGKLGLEATPEGEFTDLYLNGEYYGLYFLCQSAENLGEEYREEKEAILKLDLSERVNAFDNALSVKTEGHAFDVVAPKELSTSRKEEIEQSVRIFLDKMENGQEEFLENIDIESWAKKYLIDEIFANFDSMSASSYMKLGEKNGEPFLSVDSVWDFDNSIGNRRCYSGSTRNPNALYSWAERRGSTPGDTILWYSKFYESDAFYQELVREYFEEAGALMQEMVDKEIPAIDEMISSSAHNNQIRWNYSIAYDDEVAYIKDYLGKRKAFLDSIWGKEKDYCVVSFEENGKQTLFYYFFVEKGNSLSQDMLLSQLVDVKNRKWVNADTGEKLDTGKAVFEDGVYVSGTEQRSLKERLLEDKALICIFSLFVFVALTGILVFREKRIGG